jgi:secreted trypsin-like serine protease
MKRALLWALLPSACGGPPVEAMEHAIVGGEVAGERFPNVGMSLRVLIPGYQACSGTLVAPDVVLTAGHCLDPPPSGTAIDRWIFTREPAVDIGRIAAVDSSTRSTRVVAAEAHPLTRADGQLLSDVAVLYLAAPMVGVPVAEVFDASDAARLVRGDPATAVGYGREARSTRDDGPPQVEFRRKMLELALSTIGTEQLHATSGDESVCFGDSGGPLFIGARIAGVLSRGGSALGCSLSGNFARVDVHRTWIDRQMIAACVDGARSAEGCAIQQTLLPSLEEPPEVRGEGLRPIEAGPIDAGDGPAPGDGCSCLGRRASWGSLAALALLAVFDGRRRKLDNPSPPLGRNELIATR